MAAALSRSQNPYHLHGPGGIEEVRVIAAIAPDDAGTYPNIREQSQSHNYNVNQRHQPEEIRE